MSDRHPVDVVMDVTWGPRLPEHRVAEHLIEAYGIVPEALTNLDGAWRVDLPGGRPSWVVRVGRPERPPAAVERDLAMLRHLETCEFPAERPAPEAPMTVVDGHPVAVTTFVDGAPPAPTEATWIAVAALAGRLAALPIPPASAGLAEDAGAFHHFTPVGSPAAELAHAGECLGAVADQVPEAHRPMHERLRAAVDGAPDLADLSRGLVHPDLLLPNVLDAAGALVLIDWAGAGVGPRALALGGLVRFGALDADGWSTSRLHAILDAFEEHTPLTAEERSRLTQLVQHKALVMEAFGFAIGIRLGGDPLYAGQWSALGPHLDDLVSMLTAR